MTSEAQMKQWLDGWFFTLDYAQSRTRSSVVPHDHIPDHKPMFFDADNPQPQCVRKRFLPSEEAMILKMRGDGMRWKDIAKRLKRSVRSLQERYIELRRERGLKADTGHVRSIKPVTPAMKARMVELKAQGMSFARIAKELDLTVNQVADHYNRIVRRHREKGA